MTGVSKSLISVELLVLCDYALVSQENKLSVMGIFDQIFVEKIPAFHHKMFAVGIVKGDANMTYEVSLRIAAPDGKEILSSPKLSNKFGDSGRSNLILGLENLPLQLIGEYRVELESSGIKLGEMTFKVLRTGGKDEIKRGSKLAD